MADVRTPNKAEISRLPRCAQVAFAARCARRVQPLFNHFWPDAPKKHLDAVDAAVRLAENCASTASLTASAVDAVKAYAAANATTAAYSANTANAAAAVAAANAADATAKAADATANAAVTAVAVAAGDAAAAANAVAAKAGIAEIVADFEFLLAAAEGEQWDDNTPVPPEFFGPMWPNGTPDGWPEEVAVDAAQVLKLQIAVPQDMNDTQSRDFNEKVKAFLTALSAFDASMGGTGLQILDDASNEYVDAHSEEPIEEHDRPLAGVGA